MLGDTCDTIRGGNCPIFPNNGPGVGLCNGLCVVPIDPDECVYHDLDSRLPDCNDVEIGELCEPDQYDNGCGAQSRYLNNCGLGVGHPILNNIGGLPATILPLVAGGKLVHVQAHAWKKSMQLSALSKASFTYQLVMEKRSRLVACIGGGMSVGQT